MVRPKRQKADGKASRGRGWKVVGTEERGCDRYPVPDGVRGWVNGDRIEQRSAGFLCRAPSSAPCTVGLTPSCCLRLQIWSSWQLRSTELHFTILSINKYIRRSDLPVPNHRLFNNHSDEGLKPPKASRNLAGSRDVPWAKAESTCRTSLRLGATVGALQQNACCGVARTEARTR